ncbi:MAG: ATP-binding protein [bacterium]|nr:ATP-binding protein [bacterium]
MAGEIDANPNKRFFIEMLTRDIGIIDSIMDLIDNSIDSYLKTNDLDILKPLFNSGISKSKFPYTPVIDVTFSSKEFQLMDNCGGISIERAKKDVFQFGTGRKRSEDSIGLSVYGIGMKRAFFKIGNDIRIKSKTTSSNFEVHIPVAKWEASSDWNHDFKSKEELANHIPVEETGTTIQITELDEDIARRFKLETFENEIISKISSCYALFLDSGFQIKVNGKNVEPVLPKLVRSEELEIVRKSYSFFDIDVLIIAGFSEVEDKKPHGWYILCNGRTVLSGNKDSKTGWGSGNQWHSKYNHFVGFVHFVSKDVEALPWTTTKDDIEFESKVYQKALSEMKILSKPLLNFLSRIYQDNKAEESPEKLLFESATPVSIEKIETTERVFHYVPKEKEKFATISYKKPVEEVEALKSCLDNPKMSNKDLGIWTFDYTMKLECDA